MYEPQEDSYLLQESIKDFLANNKINIALDMGTGTGIQGLSILNKVKTLLMSDIDKEAIFHLFEDLNKTKVHEEKLSTAIRVFNGDLFEKIPEEYKNKIDLIIFNPPYLPRESDEEDDPELTSGESGIETTKRFLSDAKEFLSRGGIIFFVASSLAKIHELEEHMRNENYEFSVDRKLHINFEDIIIYKAKLKTNSKIEKKEN
jgi:HemK-related putative methylase